MKSVNYALIAMFVMVNNALAGTPENIIVDRGSNGTPVSVDEPGMLPLIAIAVAVMFVAKKFKK